MRINTASPRHNHVSFEREYVKTVPRNDWEGAPLIDPARVARIESQIRALPIAARPVQRPAAVRVPVKPKRTAWERFKRGQASVFAVGAVAFILTCAFAGPVGLIIPAGLAIYAIAALWVRAHEKSHQERVKEQQITGRLAERMKQKSIQMHRAGLYEEARIYASIYRKLR